MKAARPGRTRVVRDPYTGPARCRECGGNIVWALTDIDKRLPFDAQSCLDPSGPATFVLWKDADEFHVQRASSISNMEARAGGGRKYAGPRWPIHWAVCDARKAAPPAPSPQLALFSGGKS